jgi:hypothetical protein
MAWPYSSPRCLPLTTIWYNMITIQCSYLIVFLRCQLGIYRSSKYGILDIYVQIWWKMTKLCPFTAKYPCIWYNWVVSGNIKMVCNLVWQTNDFASYYLLFISLNSSLDWVWSYIHSWESYSYGHINEQPPVTEIPLPGFNMGPGLLYFYTVVTLL